MYAAGADNKIMGGVYFSKGCYLLSGENDVVDENISVIAELNYDEKLLLVVSTSTNSGGGKYDFKLKMKKGHFFSVQSLTNSEDTIHNVSLVHESFSRLGEIISGLTVKSDWYGRSDSNKNAIETIAGGGALKAVLNGFELRKAIFPDQEKPKKIELSFKELYEAMNAIDNVGWGFSEENGSIYLRVERWKWFYKDDVIMIISSPNNVKRTIQSNKIYTRLKTGYSKYLDEQEINAIDTFHTEREYSTGLKAADNVLEKVCKFIADPYAIEVTRRHQFDKDTSNWKYDEDIFVVALDLYRDEYRQQMSINIGIDESEGIISPQTMYNTRISPERNAIRWAERFFEVNSLKNSLKFMSGTGNVSAKGSVSDSGENTYYLQDSASNNPVSENQGIPEKMPLLKPEILSFEYPMTFKQYAAVLRNPHGKIVVDGEACYIQKITPSLMKGIADFELIPAAFG
jgi:hypothetical protein